jgi:hypothetical protein
MAAQGKIEGKIEGELEAARRAIFAVLKARGLEVSEPQRDQILAARDLALLDRWLVQAATASTTAKALG